jgi:hypothetical protein
MSGCRPAAMRIHAPSIKKHCVKFFIVLFRLVLNVFVIIRSLSLKCKHYFRGASQFFREMKRSKKQTLPLPGNFTLLLAKPAKNWYNIQHITLLGKSSDEERN